MAGKTRKTQEKASGGKDRGKKSSKARVGTSGARSENRKGGKSEVSIAENSQPSDVQRIEALEAMVDELQASYVDLKKSLGNLFDIGMENSEIREILSSSIEGEVTGVRNGKIIGWGLNRVDRLSLLPISVYYGGKKIASTLANKNLAEHSGIPSASGRSFAVILPRQFYDGRKRSLQFKAGGVEADLKNLIGPVSFEDGFPLEGEASIDNKGIVKGWVIDQGEPKKPVIISAHYGDIEIGRALADLKEGSLEERLGKTNCHHGFKIKLPDNLGDGKTRNIRIIASSWGYDVLEGPLECKFSRK